MNIKSLTDCSWVGAVPKSQGLREPFPLYQHQASPARSHSISPVSPDNGQRRRIVPFPQKAEVLAETTMCDSLGTSA